MPAKYNEPTLLEKDSEDQFYHYRHMLENLGLNRFSTYKHLFAGTMQGEYIKAL